MYDSQNFQSRLEQALGKPFKLSNRSSVPLTVLDYCDEQGLVDPYFTDEKWWGHPFTREAEAVEIPEPAPDGYIKAPILEQQRQIFAEAVKIAAHIPDHPLNGYNFNQSIN